MTPKLIALDLDGTLLTYEKQITPRTYAALEQAAALGHFIVPATGRALNALPDSRKRKVEFLCNECCRFDCPDRRACYENVSRKNLGEDCADHVCASPEAYRGYRFSDAMRNPGFIGIDDIQSVYLPGGFSHFKIEGRSLGSAIVLEFLLYYMTKPEYELRVREEIYLDSALDLF